MANGRALALGEKDGFVKFLVDAETDRILGCHIIGARAGDLIAEIAIAVEFASAAILHEAFTRIRPWLRSFGRPLSMSIGVHYITSPIACSNASLKTILDHRRRFRFFPVSFALGSP